MFLSLLVHHQGVHSCIKQSCEHKHTGCSNYFAHIRLSLNHTLMTFYILEMIIRCNDCFMQLYTPCTHTQKYTHYCDSNEVCAFVVYSVTIIS